MRETLEKLGHECLLLNADATRHGAVETPAEGEVYAKFLDEHRGEYDGVILCLPNFGDETGAVAALRDAGVPILVQAYPDELDRMAPEVRRDAFCGKFSILDVFTQYGVAFTAPPPHTAHPSSPVFAQQVDFFDRVCRVVRGMRRMTVGAIGARTTAFKTVRFDELALQRAGITTETLDLSSVLHRVTKLDRNARAVKRKAEALRDYSSWDEVPRASFDNLVALSVVLDEVVEEYHMDALAVRCWIELQEQLGISPCVLLSEMNNRGIATACELDIGNAVAMHALRCASGGVASCLDWNNNYGDDENRCILFHCGPVPARMMTGKGRVVDHSILAAAVGPGNSYGCNVGRIKPTPFTFASSVTSNGRLEWYMGQGEFTDDPIPDDFFGCAGVAHIQSLQNVLQVVGYGGYRHHVSVTPGHVGAAVEEACTRYLGYGMTRV